MKINSKTKYSNPNTELPMGLDHGAKVIFRTIDEMVELFGDKYGVERDEANGSINYNSKTGSQLSFELNQYKKLEGKKGTIMRRPSQMVINKQGEAAAEYCIHVGIGMIGYVWLPLFTIKRADSKTNESLVINSKTKYNKDHELTRELNVGDEVIVRTIEELSGEYGKKHNIHVEPDQTDGMIEYGAEDDGPQNAGVSYKYFSKIAGKHAKVRQKYTGLATLSGNHNTEVKYSVDVDDLDDKNFTKLWLPLKFFREP